ncbi:arginine N-succinyltransferase [Endozoicomonas arenosclerae]|uniref:arginine N-succinyltransferase n=1 Tax=Endozoicomonas arenosclerae TaxID=1633495 RepID=UPI00078330ED|nr:arginine N-succinyltransferase [Endozoicomonas arenosclerae]
MKIVRPIEYHDLSALEALANSARGSMTTLPANRDHLAELICKTRDSLSREVESAGEESYHFVLEDLDQGEILGIAGINASVGLAAPFYNFRVDEEVHASETLQTINRMTALKLCQDYTGYTSLCTLFMSQKDDNWSNLQLLSRARLLFIAEHRDRFSDRILAEIQGVIDENNRSAFWDSLGTHFFPMEMSRANYLTGIQEKSFIADLMPRYPIYTRLLPKQARAVIGEPRPDREPVFNILEREGFSYQGYVDIFDAGPTLEAGTDRLTTLRDSQTFIPVSTKTLSDDSEYLVANTSAQSFRCISTAFNPEAPALTRKEIDLLQLHDRDPVRVAASY